MIGAPARPRRLTDSTNERAKELAAAGAPHGTLVTADEQTAGRGRQGRALDRAGRHGRAHVAGPARAGRGALPAGGRRGGLRGVEALPGRCGSSGRTTCWIDGRKLAGILVEGRPQEGWAVLGIGLNVPTADFPPSWRTRATSLRAARRRDRSREAVLDALLAQLDVWLRRPLEAVLEAWRERDALRGRPVRWDGRRGHGGGHGRRGRAAGGDRRRARGPARRARCTCCARPAVDAPRPSIGLRSLLASRAPRALVVASSRSVVPPPALRLARPPSCRGPSPPPFLRRRAGARRGGGGPSGSCAAARAPAPTACGPSASARRPAPAAPRGCGRARRPAAPPTAGGPASCGLHQPAGVARVGAAGRVHQQAQQPLGLRPALTRRTPRAPRGVLGQVPEPAAGLVAAADRASRRAPAAGP